MSSAGHTNSAVPMGPVFSKHGNVMVPGIARMVAMRLTVVRLFVICSTNFQVSDWLMTSAEIGYTVQ